MITSYNNFIFEKVNLNNKIRKGFNKSKKNINSYYLSRLETNIIPYCKFYQILFKNTDLDLNEYKICLLIMSSFSRIMNDDITNIKKLENEIRKENIHELYNSSFKILKTLLKILSISSGLPKDNDMLFDNLKNINIIKDFINNLKIDIYDFNSLFDDDGYKEIINFIHSNS